MPRRGQKERTMNNHVYPFWDQDYITIQKAAEALKVGSVSLFKFLRKHGVIDSDKHATDAYRKLFGRDTRRWAPTQGYSRLHVNMDGFVFINKLLMEHKYPRKQEKLVAKGWDLVWKVCK